MEEKDLEVWLVLMEVKWKKTNNLSEWEMQEKEVAGLKGKNMCKMAVRSDSN